MCAQTAADDLVGMAIGLPGTTGMKRHHMAGDGDGVPGGCGSLVEFVSDGMRPIPPLLHAHG